MNLLFNAKDLLEAVPTGTEENSAELKETILEFLAEDDARISLGGIIFGATNPEGIKSVAGDWNKEILSGLMKEINGIMANPAAFTLDSTASFRLFGAARLADDRFSIWGDAGIMWGGECYGMCYGTVMPAALLEEIRKKPEEWALVYLTAY